MKGADRDGGSDRAAGARREPVGKDLDAHDGAYGRDGGAQDRARHAGGEFGRAGIDTTMGGHSELTRSDQGDEIPRVMPGEPLRGNRDPESCAACGRPLEPGAGYNLYTAEGTRVLCPACYQKRLAADAGGRTHDVTAEVDGGSG